MDCAALGARVCTISHLTGLPTYDLPRLLFPHRLKVPRGRPPDTPEWYHCANLLNRAEASIVMSLFRRLRGGGFAAADAFDGAYRHHRGVCEPPQRISFDRALDPAAHIDGLWLTIEQSFSLATCAKQQRVPGRLRSHDAVERRVSVLQAGPAL